MTGHIQKHHKIGPGGIVIWFDPDDIDTPVIVSDSLRLRYTSTYDCATAEGCIEDAVELTPAQCNWLAGFQSDVDDYYEQARGDSPEYL